MYIEKLIPKYLEEFTLKSKREKNYVSNNTIKIYHINLLRFVVFLKEKNIITNIKKVSEQDIIRFINSLVDKNLSPATRNLITSTLKSFYKWCKKYYEIENPMKDIKCAYQPRKEAKFFSDEDLSKIIIFIEKGDILNNLIFRMLLQTGMRASELIQLNIEDIEFEKDIFKITIKNGKGNKERILPFRISNSDLMENKENTRLYMFLKIHIKNRLKEYGANKENALFISTHNKRMTYPGLRKKFKTIINKTGLKDKGYSLHTLRHTCCKRLMSKDINLKIIQKFLGHEDPITTLRIYSHVSLEEIAQANQF